MYGSRRLLVTDVATGKSSRARGVVVVDMQIMLGMIILRQLFSCPEFQA
jgi:hypothetical protein